MVVKIKELDSSSTSVSLVGASVVDVVVVVGGEEVVDENAGSVVRVTSDSS